MKILVEQKVLADMLNIVSRASSKKGDIVPATSKVHMIATNGKLTLTAYDFEVAIKTSTAEVEIITEGEVLSSSQFLTDFINRLEPRPITLELTKTSKLAIEYGKSKGNLNTYTKDGWAPPQFEGDGFGEVFTVKSDQLKKALDAVIFATAADHFRKVFTGVLFDVKDGVINLVASDTHKLAWYVLGEPENIVEKQIILPTRGLKEILRLLKADELVTASTNGNLFTLATENTIVSVRLLDGEYPNYQAIIPEVGHSIKMDTNSLRSTLERFRALPQGDKLLIPAATLFLNGNGEVKMEYTSDIAGVITEVIPLEESASLEKEMLMKFNAHYIQEIVKGIGKTTQISFSEPFKPVLITGDEITAKYILVPLRQ